MCLATSFYSKHDFAQWCCHGVVVHGEAGFGWGDLCTFLVSCSLDIISKRQDIRGGPRVYLKDYFMMVIDCAGYQSWLAGDLTA